MADFELEKKFKKLETELKAKVDEELQRIANQANVFVFTKKHVIIAAGVIIVAGICAARVLGVI